MHAKRKVGSLTTKELIALWRSIVDDGYARPFVEGESEGRETGFVASYEQAAEQLARASEMIDRSTQSFFVLPWSGQTDNPASGGRSAYVELTLTRDREFDVPIVFVEGQTVFIENVFDMGPDGALRVQTGRKFVATQTKTFAPGEAGPIKLIAKSDRPGFGYNLVQPGAINEIAQVGKHFSQTGAKVVSGIESHRLIVQPSPDVVIPEHVGSYVMFTDGANAGQIRRIIGYEKPSLNHGGVAVLAATGILLVSSIVGTFRNGEEIIQESMGVIIAKGTFRKEHDGRLVYERTFGNFAAGGNLSGSVSGAVATIDAIDMHADMQNEAPNIPPGATGASWFILSWGDLGFAVTNEKSPIGGRSPMLDELGEERGIYRSAGESDASYRERVATVADVVSPNAIRRIANRIFVDYGASACIREIGQRSFKGFFFDGDPTSNDPAIAFAYDLDFVSRTEDRFKLFVNFEEMRAFFLLGVPPMVLPEFGFAYDEGLVNAFDSDPHYTFFDGFPITTAILYRTAFQAIDKARAFGVGFDLYLESIGCD